ncbi:unnamed protein product [Adineta steineri]|uniref:Uncharacterized protein n=1 Tax=Adineta steineri TaxID=433720 RepID=A0A815A554_9BILA|nr:unnamed protein product [Adineta steineri]
MSNQEQELPEAKIASENETTNENQSTNETNENEKSSSPSSENKILNESTNSNKQEPTRRITFPQDIRYSTEQGDREKLLEKYNNYQVSDTNSCNIRFLTDHRQGKHLLGRHDDENSTLQSLSKTFNVNIFPAYQNPPKHSFKVFGTEANVRKCLIEIMNRPHKPSTRSTNQGDTETNNQSTTTTNNEESHETEVSADNEKTDENSLPQPTSIFVTTINPDSSITEEKKPFAPSTSNTNEEKSDTKDETTEQEKLKFVPLERKPEYTFTILITSQGQEVLKKNWNFFAGSLQQRLKVTVINPFKLPKFGDKQWQNELSITGELYENITDAALQLTAFINDVLGVPVQPYKADEEQTNNDSNNYQRTKYNNNNNNNDYHQQQPQQQRRYEHNNNNNYRQSPSQQYQGQSSPFNNYHERTFFNRGRNNGAYEQILLIRSNCVARIVGSRGSTLRRIQSKCHLRDIIVARHPNDNGYTDCTISAYQTRNLNFAIDTIRSYLRNEDDQAVQVLEAHYVDLPTQSSPYQNSPQNDQPQLSVPNQNFEHSQQHTSSNNRQQQQSMSLTAPPELHHTQREPGFMTRPLHFGNGTQLPQPSYNFQNTPSFDFTHRPTSASRKTDKRPGEVNDFNNTNNGHNRTSNDCQYQQNGGSSSSNSSSVSPRHKSKRTCPETKEIDCTTDDGFWIQKQYYHALDDTSKELFDSLLDKLEKIRIANDENAARKQQRLVGRNRPNKARVFNSSSTHTNGEKDLTIKSEQDNKVEESVHNDEQEKNKDLTSNEHEKDKDLTANEHEKDLTSNEQVTAAITADEN